MVGAPSFGHIQGYWQNSDGACYRHVDYPLLAVSGVLAPCAKGGDLGTFYYQRHVLGTWEAMAPAGELFFLVTGFRAFSQLLSGIADPVVGVRGKLPTANGFIIL